MRLRLTDMTVALALGTTAAVMIACGLGAWIYSRHHYRDLLETARSSARSQSEMIRTALEHQMMENDRSLIEPLIQSFRGEPGIEAVALLDREGRARYSSVPLDPGNDLTIGSPTCQACHRFPPEQRQSSRVIEARGGTVLRTVLPIRNQPRCHGCHDPAQKSNGILIVDADAGAMRASLDRDLRWLTITSGALMFLLVVGIGVVVRLVVMRRLQRFETTARRIAAGDLDRRVPATGSDTIDWLAREFNSMADSMSGLIGQVRDQRERLERVINSIDDGIVVLDRDRKVIAANDAFLRRTGHDREEIVGSCCRNVAAGVCDARDCPTLACLARGERSVRICERRSKQGEVAWEEVHSSPIRGPSGNVLQVVEVWRDISDRRAAEARLAESHRLASLGLLASGFSHEMNTPLATVLACVEGILRSVESNEGGAPAGAAGNGGEGIRAGAATGGIDSEGIVENARTARAQLLRCRDITRHFLHLSRGRPSEAYFVDVDAAIGSVVPLIAPAAREHRVDIRVEETAGNARVRVDDAALQQVLLNLLLNAVQASPQGGEVRVRVVRGDPVRIRIADDGCGIAREDQKRIFEPFCSLRRGGTGLGLFLSLNFARGWGGDIRVESDLGRGSVFEILIPEAAPASPLAVAPASSPAAERLSNVAPGHAAVKETP